MRVTKKQSPKISIDGIQKGFDELIQKIQSVDYTEIVDFLSTTSVPDSVARAIQATMDGHKEIIEIRDAILKKIKEAEEKVFGQTDNAQPEGTQQPSPSSHGNASHETSEDLNQAGSLPSEEECNADENKAASDATNLENNSSEEKKETEEKSEQKANSNQKGGSGKNKLPRGQECHHHLGDEEKKCTHCGGNMTSDTPRQKTIVISIPLLMTYTHISEACRCIPCSTSVVASGSTQMEEESIGRYHASAVASLAGLRYMYGMASTRMETMSSVLGLDLPDSTQWHLFENAANIVRPFFVFFQKEVANAPVHHIDDTSMLVQSVKAQIRHEQDLAIDAGKDPKKVRSGIHTTNLVGKYEQGNIIIFQTGLHHSGEVLEKILANRTIQEQIIIMCDAASTTPSKLDLENNSHIHIANCNSHSVRKFKELAEKNEEAARELGVRLNKPPPNVEFFLTRYKTIFENDKKTASMKAEQRLEFHRV